MFGTVCECVDLDVAGGVLVSVRCKVEVQGKIRVGTGGEAEAVTKWVGQPAGGWV